MAISPQQLKIYLTSAHRAVIFAIAQLSCFFLVIYFSYKQTLVKLKPNYTPLTPTQLNCRIELRRRRQWVLASWY